MTYAREKINSLNCVYAMIKESAVTKILKIMRLILKAGFQYLKRIQTNYLKLPLKQNKYALTCLI